MKVEDSPKLSEEMRELQKKKDEMMKTFEREYIKFTSLPPTEVEMVERREGSAVVWYFRRRAFKDGSLLDPNRLPGRMEQITGTTIYDKDSSQYLFCHVKTFLEPWGHVSHKALAEVMDSECIDDPIEALGFIEAQMREMRDRRNGPKG